MVMVGSEQTRTDVFSQKVHEKIYGKKAPPPDLQSASAKGITVSASTSENTTASEQQLAGQCEFPVKVYGAERPPPGYEGQLNTCEDCGTLDASECCSSDKRHRSQSDSGSDVGASPHKTHKTLTKNQKRKLKKKRRKEKLKSAAEPSKPYTYTQANDHDDPKSSEATHNDNKQRDLVAFWQGVWDIYGHEVQEGPANEAECRTDGLPLSALLQRLPKGHDDAELLKRLDTLKNVLTLGLRSRVQEELAQIKSLLSSDQFRTLDKVCKYWLDSCNSTT